MVWVLISGIRLYMHDMRSGSGPAGLGWTAAPAPRCHRCDDLRDRSARDRAEVRLDTPLSSCHSVWLDLADPAASWAKTRPWPKYAKLSFAGPRADLGGIVRQNVVTAVRTT